MMHPPPAQTVRNLRTAPASLQKQCEGFHISTLRPPPAPKVIEQTYAPDSCRNGRTDVRPRFLRMGANTSEGLGALVAEWLPKRGAGAVLLCGRTSPDERCLIRFRGFNQNRVRVVKADICENDRMKKSCGMK